MHNQNLLAQEGTHHIYFNNLVQALEDKEMIYQKSMKILRKFKDFEDKMG